MLITFLHSKHYRPSGMLIHWQNSYERSSSKRLTGRREAQNPEVVNRVKKKKL
jgi:hypothetical protein